jgi:hypothetical protein
MSIWIHPDEVDITSIMGVQSEWGESGPWFRSSWRRLLAAAAFALQLDVHARRHTVH